jgi:hypothetical protein
MAFRASLLSLALPFPAELDGPEHLFLHDGWIALLAALEGRIVIDERVFTRYRQHPEQFTGMRAAQTTPAHGRHGLARSRAIVDEHARVSLVVTRLADNEKLASLRPADQRFLTELEELLRHRLERPGVRRTHALVSALRNGRYGTYARGWRTALADLLYPRR